MDMVNKTDQHLSSNIYQLIDNGIIIIDNEEKIIFCNQPLCKLLKKQENELVGKYISTIIPNKGTHLNPGNDEICHGYEWEIDQQLFVVYKSPFYQYGIKSGSVLILKNKQDNRIQSLEKIINQYENALELLSECIIEVDEQGIITFLSRSFAKFLGIGNPQKVIGKHCTEVIENTRMHIVVKTGQTEIGHIQRLNNRNVIAIRIPIAKEGKIVGAIGKILFEDVQQLKVLANQINAMESKLDYYQKELKRLQGAKFSFDSIVGNSERIKEVKDMAMQVSKSRSTVLITGESGTGKELFAHAIHNASLRSAGPFIRLNCAAIPRDLLEAELFGFEDGAFTGAKKGGKPGKIELANNGTLFLDEIGDMPLDMQAKLLRVLQEKENERIGGTKISQIDVRFIAATHRNLFEMVKEGKFREDLYYRLNVFTMDIPPLRERKEDIIPLTNFLITKLNQQLGTNVNALDEKVSTIFLDYDWPGNIRELENVLERAMNVIDESSIQVQHLPVYLRKKGLQEEFHEGNFVRSLDHEQEKHDMNYSMQKEIELAERRVIIRALEKTSGNRQEAAKLLGIHRASLYRKIEKYQIE
jgi:transcriptional regulator with PAS, ATPase and Fis domain